MTTFINVTSPGLTTWTTQYGFTGLDIHTLINIVIDVVLPSLMCLLGIPANVINCLVFWSQGLRDRMNLCLFTLALVDCTYMVGIFTILPLTYFIEWGNESIFKIFYKQAFISVAGITYGLRLTSSFITMVIAVERCVCVMFPLRASTLISTRTMGTLIALTFIGPQLGHVTFPLSYYGDVIIINGKRSRIFVQTPFFRDNTWIILIFANNFLGFALPIAIFITVTTTTAVTVIKLKSASRWRQTSSSVDSESCRRERALTVMLVIAACIYIGTMLPFVARQTFVLAFSDLANSLLQSYVFLALTGLVNLIPGINSCVPCFIYFSRSSRFKKHFQRIFSPSRKKDKPQ